MTSAGRAGRPLPTTQVRAGTVLWRVYDAGLAPWGAFRFEGPRADCRFDHHARGCDDRGILYVAAGERGLDTALAEFFLAERRIDVQSANIHVVAFATVADLVCVDLTTATAARRFAAVCDGPRGRARAWSRDVYDARADVECVRYRADGTTKEPVLALYERAAHAIPRAPLCDRPLARMKSAVGAAAARIDYELA